MSDNNDKPFASPGLKVPPHDLTAEQAFLGSVMLRPEVMHEVVDVVYPDDMYSGKHRIIFKTIRALYDEHDPIDAVSVGNKLKDNKQLDQAGGASYLAELMNSVPSASNAEYYGEIVAKKSALRRLIASADKILELGYNERDHVDSIFDKAEHLIFNLASFTKKTFAPIRETLSEVWERFDKLNGTDVGMRGVQQVTRILIINFLAYKNQIWLSSLLDHRWVKLLLLSISPVMFLVTKAKPSLSSLWKCLKINSPNVCSLVKVELISGICATAKLAKKMT
jgi:hypothetical protein